MDISANRQLYDDLAEAAPHPSRPRTPRSQQWNLQRRHEDLAEAAINGDAELLKRLLHATDIEINTIVGGPMYRNHPDQTLLHHAASNGRAQCVQILLEHNADFDIIAGHYGGPPICGAVGCRRLDCAKLLLVHGASVNSRGGGDRGSILQMACSQNSREIVELLVEYGADVNSPGISSVTSPLQAAVSHADENIVRLLLEKGATANVRGEKGVSPLMAAIRRADASKLLLLLQHGAQIELESVHLAAPRKNRSTLQTLINACPRALSAKCPYSEAIETLTAALSKIVPATEEYSTRGFTADRVRSVWESGLRANKDHWSEGTVLESWNRMSPAGKTMRLRSMCRQLCRAAQRAESHFEELDRIIGDNLLPHFLMVNSSIIKSGMDDEAIIAGACKLLSQLPLTPPPLSYKKMTVTGGSKESLSRDYFLEIGNYVLPLWDDLKVAALMNTLVIQVALYVSLGRPELLDLNTMFIHLGDVINTVFDMASEPEESDGEEDAWFIVKSFVWATCQRTRLLLFGYESVTRIENGFDFDMAENKGTDLKSEASYSTKLLDAIRQDIEKPPYMCNWAYRLLISMRSPALTDLRGIVSRYAELWGKQMPRCTSYSPCSGDSPDSCLRFKGAMIIDQSAHDLSCGFEGHCYRFCWDASSYQQIGARASVRTDCLAEKGNRAIYCAASDRTLAISHVWAHGQGGRPATGINMCLHRRYCAVAERLGCDSYWIDTMCIPEDHNLRGAAIMSINSIFQGSKVCLICDVDVMSIDVSALHNNTLSRPSRVKLQESILATILFCDWNVRAWTFLESMQGRGKIYFLCKHNNTISLCKILDNVMRDGKLDIGVAFLMAPHLLPAFSPKEEVDCGPRFEWASDEEPEGPDHNEKLEGAAACLRYRPASRSGDAFVIWTILADMPTLSSAEQFWKSREGSFVSTAFLMSGAARVNARGLSWAPSDPTSWPVPDLFDPHSRAYPEAEMMGSNKGKIEGVGLSATWDVFQFEFPTGEGEGKEQPTPEDKDTVLVEKLGGAVSLQLCPIKRKLALLRPIIVQRSLGGLHLRLTRKSILPLVAVCEFVAEDGGWRWLEVRGLDSNYLADKFSPERILLV